MVCLIYFSVLYKMSLVINGQKFFRTAEVQHMVGISRNTLFCWIKRGIIGQSELRDRRGWRLFTQDDVEALKTEASRTKVVHL